MLTGAIYTVGGQSEPLKGGGARDDQRFARVTPSDAVYPRRYQGIRKPA